jgi:hypothetical protein
MKRLLAPLAGLTLLALFTALWLADRGLYVRAFALTGFKPFRFPFLDWEGVSSFVECWRRGVNVYVRNPCDVRGQIFNYSPLWLEARFIPFGPAWRNAIGLAMDAGFFASLGLVFRPATWREAALFTLAAVSPMVAFGAERANIDLAMFLLVAAGGGLVAGAPGRRAAGYAFLMFAGLLKFYPLAALVVALKERPRTFWAVAASCALVLAAFIATWRHELPLVLAAVPHPAWDMNTFGGPNLPGWARSVAPPGPFQWIFAILALAAAVAGAAALFLDKDLGAALAAMDQREQTLFVAGVAIMAGCFVTGLSGDYRAVFLLLVEAGLIEARRLATPVLSRRLGAMILVIIALMWEPALRPLARLGGPVAWMFWWPGHELLWWALTGALAALLARFAWQSETALALRPAVRGQ